MAKGSIAKEEIAHKILETFENSFIYDKEIRIPYKENGEDIQIKCVLTCAKVNVEQNEENAIPGEVKNENNLETSNIEEKTIVHIEPTEEEKQNVKNLMDALGL